MYVVVGCLFRNLRRAVLLACCLGLALSASLAMAQTATPPPVGVTPPAAYGVDTYVTGGLNMITSLNLFPIIVIAVILGIVVVVARRVRRGVI